MTELLIIKTSSANKRELVGEMNLKNLKSINASNNKFTNLNFLNSLSDKNKIEKINC